MRSLFESACESRVEISACAAEAARTIASVAATATVSRVMPSNSGFIGVPLHRWMLAPIQRQGPRAQGLPRQQGGRWPPRNVSLRLGEQAMRRGCERIDAEPVWA